MLVEKPLCTTLADADALVAAAEGGAGSRTPRTSSTPRSCSSPSSSARQIGSRSTGSRCGPCRPRPTWGSFLTEAWGGGVLFDLGVHPLAVALLLAAPPGPSRCVPSSSGADDHPVDEHAELDLALRHAVSSPGSSPAGGAATPRCGTRRRPRPTGWSASSCSPTSGWSATAAPSPLPGLPEGVPPQLEELGYLRQLGRFALDLRDGRVPELGAAFGRSILDVDLRGLPLGRPRRRPWVELPFARPPRPHPAPALEGSR